MNLGQMLDLFGVMAHDTAEPGLWPRARRIALLNEAQLEGARRARVFEDYDTAEVCKLTIKAGKSTYDIDPRVIFIRRFKLASQDTRLPKISILDMDRCEPGWMDAPAGVPTVWIPWGDHKVRLYPTPSVDDVANMGVVREPMEDLAANADEPEMPRRTHPRLIDYALGQAYLERDLIEKYRPEEARERTTAFDREFGPPSSILDELWIHRKHGYDEDEGLE